MNAIEDLEFDTKDASFCRPKGVKPTGDEWRRRRQYGPDGLTRVMRQWLQLFEQTGNQSEACRMMCRNGDIVRRGQISQWVKHNESFREMFKIAKRGVGPALESEMRRRAIIGDRKYLYYKGEPVMDPRTGKQAFEVIRSDRMLEIALKSYYPEKYRERSDVNVNGSITLTNISDAELEERERQLGLIPQRFVLPTATKQAN